MSLFPYDAWLLVVRMVVISTYAAAGAMGGAIFFRALWWNTRIIVGGSDVSKAVALALGRFGLMTGLLTMAALAGAAPLLATALGVFIGRLSALRSIRKDA